MTRTEATMTQRFPSAYFKWTNGDPHYVASELPPVLSESLIGQVFDAENSTAGELLGFVPFRYSDRASNSSDNIEHYMVYLLTEAWNVSQAQYLPKLSRFETSVLSQTDQEVQLGRLVCTINVYAGSRIFQTEQEARENAARMIQAELAERDDYRASLAAPSALASSASALAWTCWECGCEYANSRTPDSYDVNGPYCGC